MPLFCVLTLGWCVLTGGAASSWVLGLPAILICLVTIRHLPSEGIWWWTPVGILQFIPFFIHQSIVSGCQVAWLAVQPNLHLTPELLHYEVRLPTSPARVFFANSISMLPGTLSCILVEDLIVVHVLNPRPSTIPSLSVLEKRVARLFGLTLQTSETPPHA